MYEKHNRVITAIWTKLVWEFIHLGVLPRMRGSSQWFIYLCHTLYQEYTIEERESVLLQYDTVLQGSQPL